MPQKDKKGVPSSVSVNNCDPPCQSFFTQQDASFDIIHSYSKTNDLNNLGMQI